MPVSRRPFSLSLMMWTMALGFSSGLWRMWVPLTAGSSWDRLDPPPQCRSMAAQTTVWPASDQSFRDREYLRRLQ